MTKIKSWWNSLPCRSRGVFILGVLWFLIGIGVCQGANVTIPQAFHTRWPAEFRGVVWMFSGFVAVASVLRHRGEAEAMGILQIMPTIRVISYFWSWIVWLLPGDQGYRHGWYQAVFHLIPLLCIWLLLKLTPGSTDNDINNDE